MSKSVSIEQYNELSKLLFDGRKMGDKNIEKLPTGVKQILAAKILSTPNIVTYINEYCLYHNTNDIICRNPELYKTLWSKYMPLGAPAGLLNH